MSLRTQLHTLEASGLLRLVALQPDLEYLFRHALVQEAAYTSLLDQDRKRLHLAVGEALESLYPERCEELAPQLARHFAEAGAQQRALEYFILAGDVALSAYANQEAEGHYRAALELGAADDALARALYGLGRAVARQSRYAEAIAIWRDGIGCTQQRGDADMMARMYAFASRAAWFSGDWPGGLRLGQEGMAAVAGMAESPGLAALIHETGRAYYFNGAIPEARAHCEQALELARRLGVVDVQAETLSTMGLLPDQAPEQAFIVLQQAIELAESAALPGTANRAHINLSSLLSYVYGDPRSARVHTQRAIEMARRQGTVTEEFIDLVLIAEQSLLIGDFASAEATILTLRRLLGAVARPERSWIDLETLEAMLLLYRGDGAEALRRLRLLLPNMRLNGDDNLRIWFYLTLSDALIENRNLDEAAQVWLETITLGEQSPRKGHLEWLSYRLAEIYARQGQVALARATLDAVPLELRQRDTALDKLRLASAETYIALAEQRWDAAFDGFAGIATELSQMNLPWWQGQVLLEWAAALALRSELADLERARTMLRKAMAIFEQISAPGYVARAQEQLDAVNARIYAQAVVNQQTHAELTMAAEVQAGLLPVALPQLDGWQLAALLKPARETAGDFYDCIALPDGRLGLVIADVADKGVAAALYMALGRTLIRTYASEYGERPDLIMAAANRRILSDTQADLFITAFYGLLDPASGTLTYCNAGHNPPYLVSPSGGAPQALGRTGLPLGVIADGEWTQASVQIQPGDVLLFYTDGITEAQNSTEQPFGSEHLRAVALAHIGQSAAAMRDAVIAAVRDFVGNAPQFDDITLLIVRREPSETRKT